MALGTLPAHGAWLPLLPGTPPVPTVGQDLGPAVAAFCGDDITESEWSWVIARGDVVTLARALGVEPDGVLGAFAERFSGAALAGPASLPRRGGCAGRVVVAHGRLRAKINTRRPSNAARGNAFAGRDSRGTSRARR